MLQRVRQETVMMAAQRFKESDVLGHLAKGCTHDSMPCYTWSMQDWSISKQPSLQACSSLQDAAGSPTS